MKDPSGQCLKKAEPESATSAASHSHSHSAADGALWSSLLICSYSSHDSSTFNSSSAAVHSTDFSFVRSFVEQMHQDQHQSTHSFRSSDSLLCSVSPQSPLSSTHWTCLPGWNTDSVLYLKPFRQTSSPRREEASPHPAVAQMKLCGSLLLLLTKMMILQMCQGKAWLRSEGERGVKQPCADLRAIIWFSVLA